MPHLEYLRIIMISDGRIRRPFRTGKALYFASASFLEPLSSMITQLSSPRPISRHSQFKNRSFWLLIAVMSREFRWGLNTYQYQSSFSFNGRENRKPGPDLLLIFSHRRFLVYSEIRSEEQPAHGDAITISLRQTCDSCNCLPSLFQKVLQYAQFDNLCGLWSKEGRNGWGDPVGPHCV